MRRRTLIVQSRKLRAGLFAEECPLYPTKSKTRITIASRRTVYNCFYFTNTLKQANTTERLSERSLACAATLRPGLVALLPRGPLMHPKGDAHGPHRLPFEAVLPRDQRAACNASPCKPLFGGTCSWKVFLCKSSLFAGMVWKASSINATNTSVLPRSRTDRLRRGVPGTNDPNPLSKLHEISGAGR